MQWRGLLQPRSFLWCACRKPKKTGNGAVPGVRPHTRCCKPTPGGRLVIDAVTDAVIGGVALGGRPEFAAVDGKGRLY